MDDLERRVIDAVLDGAPASAVIDVRDPGSPNDRYVSLGYLFPRLAEMIRETCWCPRCQGFETYPVCGVCQGTGVSYQRIDVAINTLKGDIDG